MQTFAAEALIIDHRHTDLNRIPDVWITQAKNTLHIAYQHTSHGSQIVTGMGSLRDYPSFGTKYDFDDAGARAGALDLDDYGIPGGSADLSTRRLYRCQWRYAMGYRHPESAGQPGQ